VIARYALLPKSVTVGSTIEAGEKVPATPGNRMPLSKVPLGAFVYNVELKPGAGAKMGPLSRRAHRSDRSRRWVRDAKMPSSEVRQDTRTCWATLGDVSNDGAPPRDYRQGRPASRLDGESAPRFAALL